MVALLENGKLFGITSRGTIEAQDDRNFPYDGNRMRPGPDEIEHGAGGLFPHGFERGLAISFDDAGVNRQAACSPSRVTWFYQIGQEGPSVHDLANALSPWADSGSREPAHAGS